MRNMRKYCDSKRYRPRYFDGFTRFPYPWLQQIGFWIAVCLYVCSRTCAWTVGRSILCSIFKSPSTTVWWQANMNILAQKTGTLDMGPPNTELRFSPKRSLRFWLNLSCLRRPPPLIQLHRRYLQENNGTPSSGLNPKRRFWRKTDWPITITF
jgi:hypothetical protein